MTVRIGNTRIDPLAGAKQILAVTSQLAMGEKITSKGKRVDLRHPKPMQESAWDVGSRFVRSKFAPGASLITDMITGSDYLGRPTQYAPGSVDKVLTGEGGVLVNALLPMTIPDIYDALKEHGLAKGFMLPILTALGESVNTYSDDRNSDKARR